MRVFSNWKVTFRPWIADRDALIKNNHTAEISGDDLKELIVTAVGGRHERHPAGVRDPDTIPTDTPKYRPDGSISKPDRVSYSGSTVA